jgi:hypothetical protein
MGVERSMNTAKKVWRHFLTVCRHKHIVFRECKACGIAWRGFWHDMSKFSPTEFIPSAKYFQGDRSPTEAEKDAIGYSAAWMHHKGHNPHHWEYWTEFDDNGGNVVAHRIPTVYVIEMVCDWIGAGIVYSKEKWTQKEPLEYWEKCRKNRYFHPETEQIIVNMLNMIAACGLEVFHVYCRSQIHVW